MTTRKSLSLTTKKQVLHEAGYQCSNPICRTILTLDIHHLDYVSNNGKNTPDNLLALCPNCHSLHHKNHIPLESLRAWKMFQLSLNEAFDRRSINLLITIAKQKRLDMSGEGVIECSSLIASGLVSCKVFMHAQGPRGSRAGIPTKTIYELELTQKGSIFYEAWENGDQNTAINFQKLDD